MKITAAEEAIKENPAAIADFKAGKEKALNSLVGSVMKKTKGRADARTTREMLLGKMGRHSRPLAYGASTHHKIPQQEIYTLAYNIV